MTEVFTLHERLAADTVALADWPLCRVLLMKDAGYPWLILVPRRPGLKEFHDMAEADLALATAEICRASRTLQSRFAPDKINIGALGNMVPQLHIHVIARFRNDPAWPGPVWGARPAEPYESGELQERIETLKAAFG
ncbi:HIT family protein [Pelagibius sp. 7325]|uniref:HIT family protein n=1 Tax=Pelagibius sp. 7325 TaxID=3131994 RepID=UPI0030EB4FA4